MCGLTGFLSAEPMLSEGEAMVRLVAMTESIIHRGPDSAGHELLASGAVLVGLGHRRLSIVDVSPAGAQPMRSASGRYVLAFNGEIYNHAQLRRELEREGAAPAWRGHSDTETLLAAIECWGFTGTLRKCVGMFAIALWDGAEGVLTLARDRFGEKPLYYGWAGSGAEGAFVFGSELKALRTHPRFANRVCRTALAQYLRFLYVPAPLTMHEGMFKLEPGCLLTVRGAPPARAPSAPVAPGASHESLSVRRWYSLAEAVEAGTRERFIDEAEAVGALEERLAEAVRLQSLADVPLGAFLSGGVDSSAIAALMQRQSSRPVKTFTIGFEDASFDESSHARAVARHLGTEHHELFVTAQEARALIPLLPAMYDEPFADSSQIPTHLVCRAARRHVTVALSGDAGDELFGGYNRYFWGPRIWDRVAWLPHAVRQGLASGVRGLSPSSWDRALGHTGVRRPGEKLHKLANALNSAESIDDLYRNLVSEWKNPAELVIGCAADQAAMELPPLPSAGVSDSRARMMYWDSLTYLPDDILCKVDRAAMATSLETRVPFLDHRVAELAWRLPVSMKIRGNEGKWAVRQILYKHVPRALIERPKTGFAIPLGEWLRGPLRDWADDLLNADRLSSEGFLRPKPIRSAWNQHLGGRYDAAPALWPVLIFQSWLESLRAEGPK